MTRTAVEAHWRIDAHERECALRQEAVTTGLDHLGEGQERIERDLGKLRDALEAKATVALKVGLALNWKAWAVAGFVISLLVGSLGWSLSQVYQLRTAPQVANP